MNKSKLPARRLVLREMPKFKDPGIWFFSGYMIVRIDLDFPLAMLIESFAFGSFSEEHKIISTIGNSRLKRKSIYDLHTDIRKLALKRARRRLRYWSKLLKLPFIDETLKHEKEKNPAPAMKRPKRKSRKNK